MTTRKIAHMWIRSHRTGEVRLFVRVNWSARVREFGVVSESLTTGQHSQLSGGVRSKSYNKISTYCPGICQLLNFSGPFLCLKQVKI